MVANFKEQTILTESKKMQNRLKSGKTVDGSPMQGLSDAAKITRILRGHNPTASPLNASGKLFNSIKPIKSGVSINKYGLYQSQGFTTQNNPVIPEGNKKPKGGLKKRQFRFAGKSIPSRKWVHDDTSFKYDKRVLNALMKKIGKALKK